MSDLPPVVPAEVDAALRAAYSAALAAAREVHERATALRSRAVEERDSGMRQEALVEYARAIEILRPLALDVPTTDDEREAATLLADAFHCAERHEEAATLFAAVRDASPDAADIAILARRVVFALVRSVESAQTRGELVVRDRPPPASAETAVVPIPLPPLLEALVRARETYLVLVVEAPDTGDVRREYALADALVLYTYGYWDEARRRLWRIYDESCDGARASPDGARAFVAVRDMAVALDDTAEVARLSESYRARGCLFGRAPAPPSDPMPSRFASAVASYERAEDLRNRGDVRGAIALYERAATELVAEIERDPDHHDVPHAWLLVGQALVYAGRFAAAARVFGDLASMIDGLGVPTDSERRVRLDGILSIAWFSEASALRSGFDYEGALARYAIMAASRRLADSPNPSVPQIRVDAVVERARLFEYFHLYDEAADAYERAAPLLVDGPSPAEEIIARYFAARMPLLAQDWRSALRALRAFIRRYDNNDGAVEEVVAASFDVYEALRSAGDLERRQVAALEDVIERFEHLHGRPGTMAADHAAHALVLLAVRQLAAVADDLAADLRRAGVDAEAAVREAIARVEAIGAVHVRVGDLGRPPQAVAGWIVEARAWQALALAVDPASSSAGEDEAGDAHRAAADAWREALRCRAGVSLVRAARALDADLAGFDVVRAASEILGVVSEIWIAGCVERARAGDPPSGLAAEPTLDVYVAGELPASPLGATWPDGGLGVAPPVLDEGP